METDDTDIYSNGTHVTNLAKYNHKQWCLFLANLQRLPFRHFLKPLPNHKLSCSFLFSLVEGDNQHSVSGAGVYLCMAAVGPQLFVRLGSPPLTIIQGSVRGRPGGLWPTPQEGLGGGELD